MDKLLNYYDKTEIREMINEWFKLDKQVQRGNLRPEHLTEDYFEQVFRDDNYVDGYLWIGDAEYCVTLDTDDNDVWVNTKMMIALGDDVEYYELEELRRLAGLVG